MREKKNGPPLLPANVLAELAQRESAMIDGIKRGLEDVRSNRTVAHDEAMKRLRAAIDRTTKTK